MSVKQTLHRLVDNLPKSELPMARRFLEQLCGKPAGSLRARKEKPDMVPLSIREIRNIQKSLTQIRRGQTVSLDEYKRTRGL